MIPMVNLKDQYATLESEIQAGLQDMFNDCSFVLGPNVQAFEQEMADYLGVKQTVGVASGTDALHLALLAEGIRPGDEVITTPFTFIATAEAIRYIGAIPVFVDVDPDTYNILPDAIEAAISPRTSAIMPVHLFGQPANMQAILAIAERYKLKIIEDCAQSTGATFAGRQTGSLGHSAGFSFFPSKNLGAYGDGGLVATQSDEVAERLRVLRNHGSKVRYYHDMTGFNSRLDEMQAVVLRVKLKRLDHYNKERRRVAALYSELMAGLPLQTPYEDGLGVHVYHQYTLLSDQREKVMKALQEESISSAIYYPVPLHQQAVFAEFCSGLSLPNTEALAKKCFSLPIYPELADETIERIVGVIRKSLS